MARRGAPARALAFLPFASFNEATTCPKCGTSGFYPRNLAQWHPKGDAFDGRSCHVDEHLHALCPTCNYALYFFPADYQLVVASTTSVN